MRWHVALWAGLLSCHSSPPPPKVTPVTWFTAQLAETRFDVADHMRASVEMQISGEPFAQLLGRNLAGYNRFSPLPDLYIDADGQTLVDPLSYSIAVESYEYSKQPMNQLSFESGAGLSLMFGPMLNPTGATGDAAVQLLLNRLQYFADIGNAGGMPGTAFVIVPAPDNNPLNVYGWPGYWPAFAEFRSYDPAITPTGGGTRGCTMTGGYAASGAGNQVVGTYECGYVSLNLPNRDQQVEKRLEPAALGMALWKQGLWTINYWQSLQDVAGNAIIDVDEADLPLVGTSGNQVVGRYADPNDPNMLLPGQAGVYLGDIPIEGWQGLTMLEEAHNKAALLLQSLTTSDGAQLGGFASSKEAIDYGYRQPLRWWPHAVAVVEDSSGAPPAGNAWKYFPRPTGFSIDDGGSRLRDLTSLAGGFAEYFALTDAQNPDVGGGPGPRATFDGDPFPGDNQLPDGEESPHDRALAIMKVAIIDLDRIHFDAANQVLVDEATVAAGKLQRGARVTTLEAAYSIVALRTAFRSMSSTLALYSNDTPDTHGLPTRVDGARNDDAPAPLPDRILGLIGAEADFISSKLVAADGSVANGYDLAGGAPDRSPATLEAEAGAIRGLLDAYLATARERYRDTAIRIYADLEARFWMKDVRAFRTVAGVDDSIVWTPAAFGALQGALRQYWKLVARRPGNEGVASELLERIKRTNKLVANGWDDANDDDRIQYPGECTGAGLQMGERALTGERGTDPDGDFDRDCVKDISRVQLPASLAAKLVLKRR
jgi:hypothetical protein